MATNSVTVTDNPAKALYTSLNGTQKTTEGANAVTDQQSRFLTLLTAQLKNQDPLNPMDNAQMTSQLAQISTVDSLERLNKALEQLLNSSTDTQSMQAAALVGHSVLVPGSELTVAAGGVAAAGVELTDPADEVKVTVSDANGLTVRTLQLGEMEAGVHGFTWDGKNDAGAAVADGSYKFSVAAKTGDNKVTANALELGMVSSVDRSGGAVQLNLGNLGLFTMADIKQIF